MASLGPLTNLRAGGWNSSGSTLNTTPSNQGRLTFTKTRTATQLSYLQDVRAQPPQDTRDVLNSLVQVFHENNVPGPNWFRLETEFTEILGRGAQCTVHAIGQETRRRTLRAYTTKPILRQDWPVSGIAVKKYRSLRTTTFKHNELSRHLSLAKREIETLSSPHLRKHKNIVQLRGWGFCLDTQDNGKGKSDALQIPLLVLERAHCDLLQLLQGTHRSPKTHILRVGHLRSILLDVGHGLQALHEQLLVHGDLKPENVVLFYDRHQKSWTAKLCDFGHTRGEEEGSHQSYRYYGTPGWQPPEAQLQDSYPLQAGSLRKCDIFVYGLLVWSVMLHRGRPPMEAEPEQVRSVTVDGRQQRARVEPKDRAYQELAARNYPQSLEWLKRPIATMTEQCLEIQPEHRPSEPWQLLESWSLRLKRYLKSRRKPQNSAGNPTFPTSKDGLLLNAETTRFRLDGVSSLSRFMRKPRKHPRLSILSKCSLYSDVYQGDPLGSAGQHEHHTGHTDHTTNFEHYPNFLAAFQGCWDMDPVYSDLHDHLHNNSAHSQLQIYALARCRARAKRCCWHKACILPSTSESPRRANMVSLALQARPVIEIAILAWLCQGPVGLQEVAELGSDYQTWKNVLDPDQLNESERLERFLLLLQFGARVEQYDLYDGYSLTSLLFTFCQSLSHFNHGTAMREICSQFAEIKHRSHIHDTTYDYLAGPRTELDHPHDLNANRLKQCALYDFTDILNLAAAQEIINAGFPLSPSSSRALSERANSAARYRNTPEARDLALGFSTLLLRSRPTLTSSPTQTLVELPLGWETIKIPAPKKVDEERSDENKTDECYRDTVSGSLTFIKPRASLLENRYILVGYASTPSDDDAYTNERFLLDTSGFITAQSVRNIRESIGQKMAARFPIYDEAWFKVECFDDEDKPDILRVAPAPWRLPTVPFPTMSFPAVSLPTMRLPALSSYLKWPFTSGTFKRQSLRERAGRQIPTFADTQSHPSGVLLFAYLPMIGLLVIIVLVLLGVIQGRD